MQRTQIGPLVCNYIPHATMKKLCTTTETWQSQIKFKIYFLKKRCLPKLLSRDWESAASSWSWAGWDWIEPSTLQLGVCNLVPLWVCVSRMITPLSSHLSHTSGCPVLYSLSHKHLRFLASREVNLRCFLPSPHVAALQINSLFAANLGVSVSWFAVPWAKWTWFSNTCLYLVWDLSLFALGPGSLCISFPGWL